MRDYGKVAPTFWNRGTGMSLRGHLEAQNIALYLMSAPTSNMIGLYYLPVSAIAHDTGIPLEGAWKALRRLIEGVFCIYSEGSETVFVRTMARRQLGLEPGEVLKPGDKRIPGIVRLMHECVDASLLQAFWDEYQKAFRLPEPWWEKPLASPSEDPPKPLRSQDQDQDQDQKQDQDSCSERSASAESSSPPAARVKPRKTRTDIDPNRLPPCELAAYQAIVDDESLAAIVDLPAQLARDLCAAGPGVDVSHQCRKAGAWLRANPKKAKKNGARFLLGWIEREQERRGGSLPFDATAPQRISSAYPQHQVLEPPRKLTAEERADAIEAAKRGKAALDAMMGEMPDA